MVAVLIYYKKKKLTLGADIMLVSTHKWLRY